MIKHIILSILFFAIATHARPQEKEVEETVYVRNYNDNTGDTIKWGFETPDGTVQEQEGYVKNAGTDMEMTIVKGKYSYKLADGRTITVEYYSDETGYHADVKYTDD